VVTTIDSFSARLSICEYEERWTITGGGIRYAQRASAGSAGHCYNGKAIAIRACGEPVPAYPPASVLPAMAWARRLSTLGIDACTWTRTVQFMEHAFPPEAAVRDRRQWCTLEVDAPLRLIFFFASSARHRWPEVRSLLSLAARAGEPSRWELPARLPVIFGCGTAGIVFHEVAGHALEADVVGGTSLWRKAGQSLGPPFLTVADDPAWPGLSGSRRMDDEGQPARRRVLLDHGVLKDPLCDLRTRELSRAGAGSARAGSFVDPPVPRVSNTVLDPDPSAPRSPERLFPRYIFVAGIASARFLPPDGIEIEAGPAAVMAGGRVQAVLPRLLVAGRQEEWLRDVSAVGPRTEACLTFGWCSKDGRPVPVGAAAPWVAYPSLKIGTA
jgi:hypothetical protein